MKLATYYKNEENHFCRLVSLEETDLSMYDKIYIFSEAESTPKIPNQFLRANNVILGGTAFTNGEYIPFENEIIDYTLPRPAIYQQFLKEKYDDGIKTKVIGHVLDDTYYRMYAGKNKLPLPAIIPRKRTILYDKNFFYPDWQETLKEISDRKSSKICRIHPIICTKLSDYFMARNFVKLDRAIEYYLDLELPLDQVDYLFKHYKHLFLADIAPSSNIFITIGNTHDTYLQYAREINYKLNLLYSFWSRGIMIRIKFVPCKIGYNNPFAELSKLIETWSNNTNFKRQEKTILERIPKKKTGDILREQYKTLLKYSPKSTNLFNRTIKQICEGGNWHYEY